MCLCHVYERMVYTIWSLTNDLKGSRTVKKEAKITYNRLLMELFVKPPAHEMGEEGLNAQRCCSNLILFYFFTLSCLLPNSSGILGSFTFSLPCFMS